jgi:uncharacterized protein YdeI (YjbR/CyaY-like superfamily)
MTAIYFTSPDEFRAWLEANHERESALLVGFHKRDSNVSSMTWAEAVDEALCFGWIDGVRRRVDDDRYTIRFTPRKPGSTWSDRNITRIAALIEQARMHSSGIRAFEARTEDNSRIYSFEQDSVAFDPEHERQFKEHGDAWAYFQQQAPWYQRAAIWWVVSAKRESTRERRLAQLIEDSSNQRTIAPLTRNR